VRSSTNIISVILSNRTVFLSHLSASLSSHLTYVRYLELLSLEFNVEKSHCIVIGKKSTGDITSMNLCSNPIELCDCIKYLGVHLQGNVLC